VGICETGGALLAVPLAQATKQVAMPIRAKAVRIMRDIALLPTSPWSA
jgi:hypothetical protein